MRLRVVERVESLGHCCLYVDVLMRLRVVERVESLGFSVEKTPLSPLREGDEQGGVFVESLGEIVEWGMGYDGMGRGV